MPTRDSRGCHVDDVSGFQTRLLMGGAAPRRRSMCSCAVSVVTSRSGSPPGEFRKASADWLSPWVKAGMAARLTRCAALFDAGARLGGNAVHDARALNRAMNSSGRRRASAGRGGPGRAVTWRRAGKAKAQTQGKGKTQEKGALSRYWPRAKRALMARLGLRGLQGPAVIIRSGRALGFRIDV